MSIGNTAVVNDLIWSFMVQKKDFIRTKNTLFYDWVEVYTISWSRIVIDDLNNNTLIIGNLS